MMIIRAKLFPWRWRIERRLAFVETELRRLTFDVSLIKGQEDSLMTQLKELTDAVATVMNDMVEQGDTIKVAIEHIGQTNNDPTIAEAIKSLEDAHAGFVANMGMLKSKLDAVVASGGPADTSPNEPNQVG
jgi:hypothetical protein